MFAIANQNVHAFHHKHYQQNPGSLLLDIKRISTCYILLKFKPVTFKNHRHARAHAKCICCRWNVSIHIHSYYLWKIHIYFEMGTFSMVTSRNVVYIATYKSWSLHVQNRIVRPQLDRGSKIRIQNPSGATAHSQILGDEVLHYFAGLTALPTNRWFVPACANPWQTVHLNQIDKWPTKNG